MIESTRTRRLPSAVLSAALIAVGPAVALAGSHDIEKALEDVGHVLEEGAVKLHQHGAGEKILNAAANLEFPGAGVALSEFEGWLAKMVAKRKRTESNAEVVGQSLEKDKPKSKDAGAVRAEAAKTIEKLKAAKPRISEIESEAQAHAKLLRQTYQGLQPSSKPGRDVDSLDELFEALEKQFPHWKHDIDRIRSDHGKLLTAATTGCKDRDDDTPCPQREKADVQAAIERLQAYGQAMAQIESKYGAEIQSEIEAFVRAKPSGLLADIASVASAHTQRAKSLHTKLDWLDTGLDELREGLEAKG